MNYMNDPSLNDCRSSKIIASPSMKAYAVITLVLVANTAYIGVEAWGGLFNRFSPEMLSNLGYGGHGGYMNRPGLLQVFKEVTFFNPFRPLTPSFFDGVSQFSFFVGKIVEVLESKVFFKRTVNFWHRKK